MMQTAKNSAIGYMYEFDCKAEGPPSNDPDWVTIQYEKQVCGDFYFHFFCPCQTDFFSRNVFENELIAIRPISDSHLESNVERASSCWAIKRYGPVG